MAKEPPISLNCSICHKSFTRRATEHRRNQRLNRKIYCGNACSVRDKPKMTTNWGNRDIINQYLKPQWGRPHADEFSPFRYYVRQAKAKDRQAKYGDTNLTVEYLKKLWDIQQGRCAYTGLVLSLPRTTKDFHIKADTPLKASLDRIDSSRGYIEGNVEFVCLAVNLAKLSFSKQQMLDFFRQVRETTF